jgi:hypothetical protein
MCEPEARAPARANLISLARDDLAKHLRERDTAAARLAFEDCEVGTVCCERRPSGWHASDASITSPDANGSAPLGARSRAVLRP